MTNPTLNLVALCIWREARGEGISGMSAVYCVIRNRAVRHNMTNEQAVMVPWAFSSMTAHGDPQLGILPSADDSQYAYCVQISSHIPAYDPTQGATLYYDDSIPFPHSWNRDKVVSTVKLGRLNFFREL